MSGPAQEGMPSARTVVRTVPAHDELHRDGESLVLLDGQVRRVSMLGTLVRDRARDGLGVAELAEVLAEEFGPPPDGDTLATTAQVVATLLSVGLLEVLDDLDDLDDPAG